MKRTIVKRNGYAGLYIHFPYCIHKCSYCDFFSIGVGKTQREQKTLFESYKRELNKRLELEPALLHYCFDTIFFGGGTPSLSDKKELASFLSYIKETLYIDPLAEISIELNPEDVSLSLLNFYSSIGFTRVNVGVQSFQPNLLHLLERYYDQDKYNRLLDTLDSSAMQNYGIDLIYGIPGQTKPMFMSDLNIALASQINHLSLYSLTVEPGTIYHRQIFSGIKEKPIEDLQIEILEELPTLLSHYGFSQYEVSNYAKIGHESRHNLKYWTMEYYLGIGPGAHGYTTLGRYANAKNIEGYKNDLFDLNYQSCQYIEELAISLLRIFYPIDIDSFLEPIVGKKESAYKLLDTWKDKGLCRFEKGVFQWKPSAVLFLDEYIYELASI
jgi:putative oxygen-independent coproporphyrinogen III oxidase